MSELQEYKCPGCGGAVSFDSTSQKMKCPYCDAEFDVEAMKEHDEALKTKTDDNLNWETKPGLEWQEGEAENLRVYACKSCGGEIVTDAQTAAASCPYCDNPVIMTGQLSGNLKPDFVIPFKLDKNAAKAGLMKHLKGKLLLPKVFKEENHIDEIKGVYVPFWLFDADVDADIRYKGTRVASWSDSKYIYTRTSFYSILRAGNVSFARVPVDGSTKMSDELMESIEPFNFNEAVDFQTAYLSGFLADRYDVDAKKSIARANERIKKSTEDAFASTVSGFASVIPEHSQVNLEQGKASYALYPVWILNTTWRDEKYMFAMNGQTGKFAGNLPMDKGLFCKWLFGTWAVAAVLITLISFLFNII